MGDDVFDAWAKANVEPTPDSPKRGLPEPQKVNVIMTTEEAGHLWLRENNMCAIDWQVVNELISVYRTHGKQEIVFDASGPTFRLEDKKDAKHKRRPRRS